jgi:hypothetical protein
MSGLNLIFLIFKVLNLIFQILKIIALVAYT